jgi:sterol desaturase/sphingolipid hydroxylase (fatty acid hydroxylase superfamily)
MAHPEINNSDEPIRLFKSDFLEFFTHISPITIVVIWLPIAIYSMVRGILLKPATVGWWFLPTAYLIGLFLWTLAEYLLHRFLFHYHAKTPAQERVFFLFHGVHHAQPREKSRLVMPPVVSAPMALIFYGLFWAVLSGLFNVPHWVGPMFSGFMSGYLVYDLTHYATHHFNIRSGYFKKVRKHHMYHHFQTPNQRFGVSSSLWDYVFKTNPN